MNFLTINEESHFRKNGFLIIKSAIPADEVDALLSSVKNIVNAQLKKNGVFHEENYHQNSFKIGSVFRFEHVFDKLIDHPSYFQKILGLMGPYIHLTGTEFFVRGGTEQEVITGFHTDSGPGMQKLITRENDPYLQVKMQLFLTDLSKPNSSNFMLIPKSHLRVAEGNDPLCMIDKVNKDIERGVLPDDAIQVLVKPGDVLLFPHTLWHGVAPNINGRTRYSICFRYSQSVLRTFERFDELLSENSDRFTKRQRRLMGDYGFSSEGPYRPSEQEKIMY